MIPYCCPVCGGRGSMPHGFYDRRKASSNTAPEECRTCHGRGLVWSGTPPVASQVENCSKTRFFMAGAEPLPTYETIAESDAMVYKEKR